MDIAIRHNIRDLGGLETADGGRLRKGLLFRSAELHALEPDALDALRGLGLATIVDLRGEGERTARPFGWCAEQGIEVCAEAALVSPAGLDGLIAAARSTDGDVEQWMRDMYRLLPFSHDAALRAMFTRIAAGKVPLLFNCAAGKDRTGMAAAILLSVLGVPRTAIVADYLRTNASAEMRAAEVGRRYGWDVATDKVRAVLKADETYLAAMFEEVETRFGSVGAYVECQLGVDAAKLAAIRSVLLA